MENFESRMVLGIELMKAKGNGAGSVRQLGGQSDED
jgi:hypothetical protein